MYPNGMQRITELLSKNATYPEEARQKGLTGTVTVNYVVEKDGYVRQIIITKSLDPPLDNEAIRLIKLLKRCIPGQIDGEFVNVSYSQSFTFHP